MAALMSYIETRPLESLTRLERSIALKDGQRALRESTRTRLSFIDSHPQVVAAKAALDQAKAAHDKSLAAQRHGSSQSLLTRLFSGTKAADLQSEVERTACAMHKAAANLDDWRSDSGVGAFADAQMKRLHTQVESLDRLVRADKEAFNEAASPKQKIQFHPLPGDEPKLKL